MIDKITGKHAETLKKTGETAQKVKAEFKKSTSTAIVTAFGLLAALSWQNTIKGYIDFLVAKLNLPQDPAVYNLYASIIITLVSVVAIMLVTRWARDPAQA
jgi:type III secretory pathway component EscU